MPAINRTESIKSALLNAENFIGEFSKNTVHTALIAPYNEAIRFTNYVTRTELHKDLHLSGSDAFKPAENLTGAREAGKEFGEYAGHAVQLVVASEIFRRFYGSEKIVENKLLQGELTVANAAETDAGLAKSMTVGTIKNIDGTSTKVVLRSLDTENDVWALQRVNNAKIVRNLYVAEGFAGEAPEIAIRQENIAGKIQEVSVQEHGGKSFGGQVREWTAQSKGIDTTKVTMEDLGEQISGRDIAQFISEHPALHEATAEGIARKLADGGLDLNLSNWTIPQALKEVTAPNGPIHLYDIDPKRGFGLNITPTFGPEVKYGDAPDVVKLFEGKRLSTISQPLQTRVDALVTKYKSPGGLSSMQSAGLSEQEAQSRLARLEFLSQRGFPQFLGQGLPPEAPVIYMTPEYDEEAALIDPQLLAKAKSLKLENVRDFANVGKKAH